MAIWTKWPENEQKRQFASRSSWTTSFKINSLANEWVSGRKFQITEQRPSFWGRAS